MFCPWQRESTTLYALAKYQKISILPAGLKPAQISNSVSLKQLTYIQRLCQQPLAAFEKLTGQFISRARGHLACQFRRIIKLRDWPWPKITYKAFENILFLILITYLQLCMYIHSQLLIFFERYTHYLYKFIIHKCIWNSKGVSFVFLNTTNSKFLHANFTIFYGLTFLVFLNRSRYLIKAK